MDEMESILLYDENGEEVSFDIITKIDIKDKEYLIVIPSDAVEEDEEAIALRIDKDEKGEDVLAVVEDDEELAIVSEAFEAVSTLDLLN
ncbi:MAG TPA: DUF1292 domain-containing protein [Clostridiaceae bacterium]